MTLEEIKAKLKELSEDIFDDKLIASGIDDSFNLKAVDSIILVNFFVQTERAFSIKLPLAQLPQLTDMGKLADFIAQNLKK